MGWTQGTATDYLDLLARFATFASGNGHTILEQTSTLLSLRGEGLSGVDEIYSTIYAFSNSTTGYYNWEVCGSWGWRSGRSIGAHPMSSGKRYMYLWNTSIPYWMFGHAGRLMVVAKVGTTYQLLYLGFGLPPATEQQYPYPHIIGACGTSSTQLYSATGTGNSMFWTNQGNSGAISIPGGDWSAIGPTYCAPKWISSDINSIMITALDGSYLLEEIFVTDVNRSSIYAALDGVYKVSGFGNSAENIITVDGINYLVIPDVYRSGIGDYCAIKMA